MSLRRSVVAITRPPLFAVELGEHKIVAGGIGMAAFRHAVVMLIEAREHLFIEALYVRDNVGRLALWEFLQERLIPRRKRTVLAERIEPTQIFALIQRGCAPLQKREYGDRLHQRAGAQHRTKHGPAVPVDGHTVG